ncbi:hypothetical protein BDR22DRAFT_818029 [Usnea florida]
MAQQFVRDSTSFESAVSTHEAKAEKEATILCRKLPVSGESLYQLSKETLVAALGPEGEVIYNMVQSGDSGYYRRAALGLYSKFSRRCSSWWPHAVAPINTQKTQRTETLWSQVYSGHSARLYSSSMDSALLAESSLHASGQKMLKYEAEGPQQLCHSSHGTKDEDVRQRRTDVRLRHKFCLGPD